MTQEILFDLELCAFVRFVTHSKQINAIGTGKKTGLRLTHVNYVEKGAQESYWIEDGQNCFSSLGKGAGRALFMQAGGLIGFC